MATGPASSFVIVAPDRRPARGGRAARERGGPPGRPRASDRGRRARRRRPGPRRASFSQREPARPAAAARPRSASAAPGPATGAEAPGHAARSGTAVPRRRRGASDPAAQAGGAAQSRLRRSAGRSIGGAPSAVARGGGRHRLAADRRRRRHAVADRRLDPAGRGRPARSGRCASAWPGPPRGGPSPGMSGRPRSRATGRTPPGGRAPGVPAASRHSTGGGGPGRRRGRRGRPRTPRMDRRAHRSGLAPSSPRMIPPRNVHREAAVAAFDRLRRRSETGHHPQPRSKETPMSRMQPTRPGARPDDRRPRPLRHPLRDLRPRTRAVLAAQTVARMVELLGGLEGNSAADRNKFARCVAVKEQHAEIVKHEVQVIWSDYFKPEHLGRQPGPPHQGLERAQAGRQEQAEHRCRGGRPAAGRRSRSSPTSSGQRRSRRRDPGSSSNRATRRGSVQPTGRPVALASSGSPKARCGPRSSPATGCSSIRLRPDLAAARRDRRRPRAAR